MAWPFSRTQYAHMTGALLMMTAAALPAVAQEVPAPPVPATPVPATPVRVTVDAATELGRTNPRLFGVGWNTGSLDGVAPLAPPTVRIDGSLHEASTGDGSLHLDALLARVEAVRAIGAEPHVILSYMPVWLARHYGSFDPRDPTKVRPRDFDAWQRLVEGVVEGLATAPAPAFRFEVWNEPDLPVFWQDSPDAFFELARRTHAAVAAVEARHPDLDLEIGGPATAFPDPAFIVPYWQQNHPDFVSWHFYGNHPLLGPDGNEGFIPDELYGLIAHRNPVTSPREFAAQVEMVRSWVGDAELVIDEWNVSAGGFDQRHDTSEGAAFDAGVLMEMEAAGLDAADFYRAMNGPGDAVGDWGMTRRDGSPKPAWWVFGAFNETQGIRLRTTSLAGPDLYARATRSGPTIHVLVSNFDALGGSDHEVRVTASGATCAPRASVRILTGPDGTFEESAGTPVVAGAVDVALPAQSVAWVSFRACS